MAIELSKTAKGELTSPITQAIVRHLWDHGPSNIWDIDQVLIKVDGYSDNSAMAGLQRRLRKLQAQGHIHRTRRGDTLLYVAGPDPRAEAPAPKADLVEPARRNVMAGDPYTATWNVARPGALDYAKCPSLHMGKRRDFRSEAAA